MVCTSRKWSKQRTYKGPVEAVSFASGNQWKESLARANALKGHKISQEEKKKAFDHFSNPENTNARLLPDQSNNTFSFLLPVLPPLPWSQRAQSSIMKAMYSHLCSLGILLLELSHHIVRKSKQVKKNPMWRETDLWLSSQTTAGTYLQVMWNSYLESRRSSHHWLTPVDIRGVEISYPHPALSKLQADEKNKLLLWFKATKFWGGLLLSNSNRNRLPSPVGMGKALNRNKY